MPRGGSRGRGRDRGTKRGATASNLDGAVAKNTRHRSQNNTSRNTGESTNSAATAARTSTARTAATEVERNGGVTTRMRDLCTIQGLTDRAAAARSSGGSSQCQRNQSNQVPESQNQGNQTGSGAVGSVSQGNCSVSRVTGAAIAGDGTNADELSRGAGVPGESFSNVSIDICDLGTPNNMMQCNVNGTGEENPLTSLSICSPLAETLPQALKAKIIKGKFVDFGLLLDKHENVDQDNKHMSLSVDETGKISWQENKPKKSYHIYSCMDYSIFELYVSILECTQ